MCQYAPIPGFYDIVISLPTPDFMLAWFLMLIPLILPIWLYITRPVTDAIALLCLRFPKPTMKLPTVRWFLIQSALLTISCSILTFVAIPSDLATRRWLATQEMAVCPECLSALNSLKSMSDGTGAAIFMLGVVFPFLIVMIREFLSRYPSHA
jgi:hypothetical protein